MLLKISILTFFIVGLATLASSQISIREVQIKNQLQNQIIPGKISGDKFIPTTSPGGVAGGFKFTC